MKVSELKQALDYFDDDLEVVIHTGGDDGFGYSPVTLAEVKPAVYDANDSLDGPYRFVNFGDQRPSKNVLRLVSEG